MGVGGPREKDNRGDTENLFGIAKMLTNLKKVVVAMSGGVDSTAAACLLAEQGYDVIGISMQVWDHRKHAASSNAVTCCAPSDFDDAREVASKIGFPYYVSDFEELFYGKVISPFIATYLEGKTPNPCLNCNRYVKFSSLRARAKSLGAHFVATGHYAQIIKKEDNVWGLFSGKDSGKDQSYFLYALTQEELGQTLFPVGGLKKTEVRDYLRKHNFHFADKGESQDICFVNGSVGEFIEKETGRTQTPGTIVLSSGEKVGEHDGIYNYTIGQRRGLGVGYKVALYVLGIDVEKNQIIVGEKEELERRGLIVTNVNWISGSAPKENFQALCKLRYRNHGVLCDVTPFEESKACLEFVNEWSPVSPGQAAVFYTKDLSTLGDREVIGGGIIES